MARRRYCSLLLLILIIGCDITTSDVSKLNGASFVNSLIDWGSNKGNELVKKSDETGVEIIDVALDNLFDSLELPEEVRELIFYIKEALCDPSIVDEQGHYKTYDDSEVYDFLEQLDAEEIFVIVEHVILTFSALLEAKMAVLSIAEGDLKKSLQTAFDLQSQAYKLDLKRIFNVPIFSVIFDNLLQYENSYIGDFNSIRDNALNPKN
ncbi:BTA121 domain-containing protein surface lipoprotein [Borrelia persica]|uniref:BTA121 domain-containing protein surface lipoprotein n=1 Tax=Borrelia persica TaxID=44448 RepID=UPI0004BBCDF7|nr:hypothetical protein [Borrelia persica]